VPLDFASGLVRRLGDPRGAGQGADELRELLAEGRLNGALANKLSLCNFVTPGLVRAHEWLRLQAPKGLAHLILASGRAEALDKTLRSLKYHRRQGKVLISVGPVRAGMSTAAARSASLPASDEQNWFGWPTTADPTRDPERALGDLKKAIAEHGKDKILAVAIEAVYLATGRATPEPFWAALREVCDQHELPIVLVENLSGGYRSGRGLWRADTLPVAVDAIVHYPGGQLGLGFVSDRYYVAEKLTLISTWDGDELALTRLVTELRAARQLPVAARAAELAAALRADGRELHGEGLSLTLDVQSGEAAQRRLLERGIRVGLTEEKSLAILPPLNLTSEEIARFATALREVLA
jgi:adenosylmethionine-8-amino-7-oxononanoate aminotransferase